MKSLLACAWPLGFAVLVAACDSTAPQRPSDANAQLDAFFGGQGGLAGGAGGQRPKPVQDTGSKLLPGTDDPSLDWADPCANNLDAINGSLLVYYGLHKQFPPTLDDIPKVSPDGTRISLTCPVSGKRYVYFPQGLRPPIMLDQNGVVHAGTLLLLFDPEPSHEMIQHLTDGKNDYDVKKKVHFAIFADPPVPGQSLHTYVLPMEPNLLNMYLKNAEQSVPVQPLRPAPGTW